MPAAPPWLSDLPTSTAHPPLGSPSWVLGLPSQTRSHSVLPSSQLLFLSELITVGTCPCVGITSIISIDSKKQETTSVLVFPDSTASSCGRSLGSVHRGSPEQGEAAPSYTYHTVCKGSPAGGVCQPPHGAAISGSRLAYLIMVIAP